MAENSSCDWQISCKEVKQRGEHLLQSGQWSDCRFLVGAEPNQVEIKGHKLFLAMASPVFEAMFYGGLPEHNDPIPILDVQPEAFKALLEYIYTDNININSFDKACELCYGAKKYMLPHLVEQCTKYLWSDLNPKNACRAYEFAKLFEEPVLMEKCLQIICTQTESVLSQTSFEEVELATLITVFDQPYLNIDSELELFDAAVRYSNAQANGHNQPSSVQAQMANQLQQSASQTSCNGDNPPPLTLPQREESTAAVIQPEIDVDDHQKECVAGPSKLQPIAPPALEGSSSPAPVLSIRNALQKIRFLTLTPQQFAEGLDRWNLLTQSEAFSILMNISSPCCCVPMPHGFSTSRDIRRKSIFKPVQSIIVDSPSPVPGEQRSPLLLPLTLSGSQQPQPQTQGQAHAQGRSSESRDFSKYYCQRSVVHQTDCLNTSVLDCSVTFTVDKNICVIGVQVPTQVLGGDPHSMPPSGTYSELLYAHLLDADGSRLTYTHSTARVPYNSLIEITFNRPFYIQRNKVYKVGVVFNKFGWYPMGVCCQRLACDSVFFNFGVGQSSDSIRDGLIRSIIFTY